MGRVASVADPSVTIDHDQAGLGSGFYFQQFQRFTRRRIWIDAFGEKVDGSVAQDNADNCFAQSRAGDTSAIVGSRATASRQCDRVAY
jgi:hypothetical protein